MEVNQYLNTDTTMSELSWYLTMRAHITAAPCLWFNAANEFVMEHEIRSKEEQYCYNLYVFFIIMWWGSHDDVIKWIHYPRYWAVTRGFDVFFDLRPNIRLSKQWSGWWFETPSCPSWRHCNELCVCIRGDTRGTTGVCWQIIDVYPPVTGGFPRKRAGNAEQVSI